MRERTEACRARLPAAVRASTQPAARDARAAAPPRSAPTSVRDRARQHARVRIEEDEHVAARHARRPGSRRRRSRGSRPPRTTRSHGNARARRPPRCRRRRRCRPRSPRSPPARRRRGSPTHAASASPAFQLTITTDDRTCPRLVSHAALALPHARPAEKDVERVGGGHEEAGMSLAAARRAARPRARSARAARRAGARARRGGRRAPARPRPP